MRAPDAAEETIREASPDAAGIAVIGMAGRFPGARDVAAFWRNLCAGVESISVLDDAALDDAFDAATRASATYVRARGLLADADRFDAAFFGINAREAELIDPQHRVLLETAWEALEDAGCDPAATPARIGVYAGCSIGTYLLRHVLRDRAAIETFATEYQVGSFPTLLGGGNDFLATRIAYKLDLRGPAMTVQSACSTALLAIAQAVATLRAGQADVMLAGAASISFPQQRGYRYQDGGMVARDGHCRTFDAAASGTVFGAGAGVVVLKRLADARADGDRIYAVVRGVGVNNDGSAKVGYTAPSAAGQAGAIASALRDAGVAADAIDYVECHGTATPLGDPIEVAGLAQAFAGSSRRCALGSVKPNVGHLDVAAGMAGFIKTALALQTATLPATINFATPNTRIDFDATPFYVHADLAPWPGTGASRRAGVSAFGVGGTNVHLILESEPEPARVRSDDAPQLLVLSAKTEAALARQATRLAETMRARPDLGLADVARTLQSGRRAFAHRFATPVASLADAERACAAFASTAGARRPANPVAAVAFLFPGQGAQFVGMGRELYARERAFRAAFDRCAEIVGPMLGADLRSYVFAASGAEATRALTATAIAQPAIFAVSFALAEVWRAWGIEPAATAGHSVGEFVSATLAGVFSLEDALRVVVERGRLMQALPPGAMLATDLSEADLAALLPPDVALAALNGPAQSVAAGPFAGIEILEARVRERGAFARRVATSHAFHSPMMAPVAEPLRDLVATLRLGAPQRPYVSTVTGTWIDAEQALSPAYWADHALRPVRFGDALATLLANETTVLLEVGPGQALATNARRADVRAAGVAVAGSLVAGERPGGERGGLLDALATLWTAGVAPDWNAVRGDADARIVSLPAYAFEPARHWVDPPSNAPSHSDAGPPAHQQETSTVAAPVTAASDDRAPARRAFEDDLCALLEELSGETIAASERETTFLELGFDSLFLGRYVQAVAARFGFEVTFRQLLGDVPSLRALAEVALRLAPPRADAPVGTTARTPVVPTAPMPVTAPASTPVATPAPSPAATSASAHGDGAPLGLGLARPVDRPEASASGAPVYEAILREQLLAMRALMQEQLRVFGAGAADTSRHSAPPVPAPRVPAPRDPAPAASTPQSGSHAAAKEPSRFDVFKVRSDASGDLTPAQRAHVDALVARVTARTAKSKASTQRYRKALADPRVAAGFRSEWKELVYPIVCERAAGSRLWDVDGNEYVDILNGFGQTAFGHAPDFVVAAVAEQLERGFAIGPQADRAGDVAERFCAMTGNERMTFCNTGSEAVMAAMRVARTVTGRERIVVFGGAYHGQFDEVLVKGARTSERSIPVAPGIPAASVANVTVLPYATPESLAWVREHARELAAVIVEPVQSRHPALQPREFLRDLREIATAAGCALVFDEVVTGFRMHPGGMQAVFGVRADLATYGKVVGGGLPIGILAGSARFMDALDGGTWQFGDASVPEVAPTFFAGTFVRHPLVVAAVDAVLRHLETAGPELQAALAARTAALVARLNADFERRGMTSRIETFGSLFHVNFAAEDRNASLLYYHLRDRGIYVQEGFPCFLTTAHDDADLDAIVRAFAESLDALQAVGIFGTGPGTLALAAASEPVTVALTDEQTEIYLAAQLGDDASRAYNESVTVRLAGPLDRAALGAAFGAIVARHEALRATLDATGETMTIHPARTIALEHLDVAGDPAAAEAALDAFVAADARRAFELAAGPLARATLVRLAADLHALVVTAHHVVCDGWSFNVVLDELASAYSALRAGTRPALPPATGFAAYARRQALRSADERAAVERFWLARFAEPAAPLDLPLDRPRGVVRSYRGGTRRTSLDAARTRALKAAGARQGCTLFVTLFATFGALAGRLAGSEDVVVGVPAAGQALLDGETLVGHCVNFLPIRMRVERDARYADLLVATKRVVLDAYDHQRFTLGSVVRALAPPRVPGRLPLTELQFNLERLGDGIAFADLTASVRANPKAFVNCDLFFNVVESPEGLRVDVDYNADLFDAATIDRWLSSYVAMLDACVADANAPVALGARDSRERSLVRGPLEAYDRDATVADLFEARAAARPHALAATCGDDRVTYGELDARANRLARVIVERAATSTGRVAVCMGRSLDMLAALLAVQKAGFACVPLDPAHPAERLRTIVREAEAVAAVVDEAGARALAREVPALHVGDDARAIAAASPASLAVARSGDASAYVLFTSGSTGVPKGVDVTQRSLVNVLSAGARRPGFAAGDVLFAITTIAFDIAAFELYLPLVTGGAVAIASPEDVADPARLCARLATSHANVLQATPSMWRILLDAGFASAPGFRMISGGEPLRPDLAERLLAGGGELWNGYGPTEATVYATFARIASEAPITVGVPVANTRCYVLDEADRFVPRGTVGQLHVAGDGVARGYLGRADLSAERFLADPFEPGRMYRTGDLARVDARGEIEILGRIDDQVKLRGFRIELGEIETVLARATDVAAVAVALRDDDGRPRLAAYLVARASRVLDPAALERDLRDVLPEYMIPSAWTILDALPLTANGKVDRRALPRPARDVPAAQTLPATPLERQLATIWADVLGHEAVGRDDDIFTLGADSIQIFQIVARANRAGIALAARDLMQKRTIGNVASGIDLLGPVAGRRLKKTPISRRDVASAQPAGVS